MPTHVLQITNVVPGDCRGRADGDCGQHDVSSLGEPHLLMEPLGGNGGVVGGLLV